MRNVSDKVVDKLKTHFFSENRSCRLWDNV